MEFIKKKGYWNHRHDWCSVKSTTYNSQLPTPHQFKESQVVINGGFFNSYSIAGQGGRGHLGPKKLFMLGILWGAKNRRGLKVCLTAKGKTMPRTSQEKGSGIKPMVHHKGKCGPYGEKQSAL